MRRTSDGRESASFYHRAKHLQVALMAIGLMIGLLWPASQKDSCGPRMETGCSIGRAASSALSSNYCPGLTVG